MEAAEARLALQPAIASSLEPLAAAISCTGLMGCLVAPLVCSLSPVRLPPL